MDDATGRIDPEKGAYCKTCGPPVGEPYEWGVGKDGRALAPDQLEQPSDGGLEAER